MPLLGASRWFLTAALAHLSLAGLLLLFAGASGILGADWNALVWLLLVGFVVATTQGFSWQLFPTVARRSVSSGGVAYLSWAALEGAVAFGLLGIYEAPAGGALGPIFSLAAALLAISLSLTTIRFWQARFEPALRTSGPMPRPGDRETVPLFLIAWTAALGSAFFFLLAGLSEGPGFGWWLAAVHLFVLGHALVLILAVSLRLVPRSLDADPPAKVVVALAGLATAGGFLVPVGMLLVSPSASIALDVLAAPEAAFALLFLATLLFLGVRARTARPPLALHLSGVLALLIGGGLGLGMVATHDYAPVVTHALVNVLGFVGLTILVMWFGMVAPFQRISHAWTGKMLWGLSSAWLAAVVFLAWAGGRPGPSLAWAATLGGGLLFGVAIAWGIGTVPVLFSQLNPLPGLSVERIRVLRNRWDRP